MVVSGEAAVQLREEVARRFRADVGRGRVVRVAVEHQTGALGRLQHRIEVDLELGAQLDAAHRVADQLRVAGAFLVGRNGADERLGLRGEDLGRGAEDLGRSFADQDVLGLDLEVRGDRLGQLADLVRVAAGLGAAFEQGPEAVEHLLAGPDRVLVAADADHALFDRLEVGVECGPHAVLAAAAPDIAGQRRAGADAGGLDEIDVV